MNLNDTHLVLLSAAAQRDDGLMLRPEQATGKVADKLATRLIRLGVAEEVSVGPDQPHWREDNGERIGLRITTAGLAAIGIEAEPAPAPAIISETSVPSPARPGTKRALIMEMLGQERGASLDDLIAATGWLPHTTRAALTGLRKAGHGLAKARDDDGRTIYRLDALQQAGA